MLFVSYKVAQLCYKNTLKQSHYLIKRTECCSRTDVDRCVVSASAVISSLCEDVSISSSSSCVSLSEGRSLSLEEVWSSVHPNFRLQLQHSPLNTITQQVTADCHCDCESSLNSNLLTCMSCVCPSQEHPLLGQPFFMLHPCKTEEFMRPVLQEAQDQHR